MFAPSTDGVTDLSSGGTPTLKEMEQLGTKFALEHQANSIAVLRARPAAELAGPGAPSRPVVDGYIVPTDVYSVFCKSGQNDVPLLLGWNSGDGTPFAANSKMPETAGAFAREARRRFGGMAERFLNIFAANSDLDAIRVRPAIARDIMFAWQSRTWAALQSKNGKSKAYLFYFDLIPPGRRELAIFGAHHSAEIVYALNNLHTWDLPWTDQDRQLANVMSSYWVNFARTGNPNGPDLPEWPCFAANNQRSMLLGDRVTAIATPQQPELDFFDDWFAAERKAR